MAYKVDDWWCLDSPDYEYEYDDDDLFEINKSINRHVESIDDDDDDDLFECIIKERQIGIPISTGRIPGSMYQLDEFSMISNINSKACQSSLSTSINNRNHQVLGDNQLTLTQLTNEISSNIMKIKATFGISDDNSNENEVDSNSLNNISDSPTILFSTRIEDLLSKLSKDEYFDQANCSPADSSASDSLEIQQQLIDHETTLLSESFYRLKALQSELDERTRRVTQLMTTSSLTTVLPDEIHGKTNLYSGEVAKEDSTASVLALSTASKHIVSSLNVALDTLLTALPEGPSEETQDQIRAQEAKQAVLSQIPDATSSALSYLSQPYSNTLNEFTTRLDAINKVLDDGEPFVSNTTKGSPLHLIQSQHPVILRHSPFDSLQPVTVVRSSAFKKDLSKRVILTTFTHKAGLEANKTPFSAHEWRGERLKLTSAANPPQQSDPHQQILEVQPDQQLDKHPPHLPSIQTQSFYASEHAFIASKENYLRKIQALKQSLVVSV